MKKQNAHRQNLLQRKRTKRNASRKNAVYNPNKFAQRDAVDPNSPSLLYDAAKDTVVL